MVTTKTRGTGLRLLLLVALPNVPRLLLPFLCFCWATVHKLVWRLRGATTSLKSLGGCRNVQLAILLGSRHDFQPSPFIGNGHEDRLGWVPGVWLGMTTAISNYTGPGPDS